MSAARDQGSVPSGGRRAGLLGSLLGRARTVSVDGVQFREVSREPVQQALGPKGSGRKPYDVTFPDGHAMRITCTRERLYHDLLGDAILSLYQPLAGYVRPGARILDLDAGTGASAAWLGSLTGPSGAVVAACADEESIEFARHRYRFDNVAFEVGGVEVLTGEPDHSFELLLAIECLPADEKLESAVGALWRAIAPGGLFVAGPVVTAAPRRSEHAHLPAAGDVRDAILAAHDATPDDMVQDRPASDQAVGLMIVRKPGGER